MGADIQPLQELLPRDDHLVYISRILHCVCCHCQLFCFYQWVPFNLRLLHHLSTLRWLLFQLVLELHSSGFNGSIRGVVSGFQFSFVVCFIQPHFSWV